MLRRAGDSQPASQGVSENFLGACDVGSCLLIVVVRVMALGLNA